VASDSDDLGLTQRLLLTIRQKLSLVADRPVVVGVGQRASERLVAEEMTAHVYGDAAVVTGVYREKGTYKRKPYQRRGRFTDTWVKQKGTWQCVVSQSTLISHS